MIEITLKANVEPLTSFIERAEHLSGELPNELVRIETDDSCVGELTVTFYPSDALLGLMGKE
ncbi:MAG TPA: hypothetical protein VFL97_00710 [Nitrococcus sp.]|nr:hypothetical protein [Nitrococcus sp.]